MRYCTLDGVSSKAEEADIAKAIRAGTLPFSVVDRLADYFANLRDLDTRGLLAVRDAWIWVGIPNLVLFTGRQQDEEPTTDGGQRVFAAIELDNQDRVGALIKLRCDYRGAQDEWDNNCADAIDRFSRGTRVS
jgi:hypothetical protein